MKPPALFRPFDARAAACYHLNGYRSTGLSTRSGMKSILPYYLAIFLLFALLAPPCPSVAGTGPPAGPAPGVAERLGERIPLDLTLIDETGGEVLLASLIDRPTVLTFAYFECTNVCTDIAADIARVLGAIELAPGVDFSIITVSFDEFDTPERAMRKKRDYIAASKRDIPEEGWRFLTGPAVTTERLASAVGYTFERDGRGFNHPAALVALSAEGRIIRYLYGDRYLPFDFKMAIAEAGADRPGPSIPRALLLCYTFDPEKGGYRLNFLRLTGGGILGAAGVLLFYAVRRGRGAGGGGGATGGGGRG